MVIIDDHKTIYLNGKRYRNVTDETCASSILVGSEVYYHSVGMFVSTSEMPTTTKEKKP